MPGIVQRTGPQLHGCARNAFRDFPCHAEKAIWPGMTCTTGPWPSPNTIAAAPPGPAVKRSSKQLLPRQASPLWQSVGRCQVA